MKNKELFYVFTFLAFSALYVLISYWLQTRGFYNLESDFIEYKKVIFFSYEQSLLRTFYFTEPFLLYLGSLIWGFPHLFNSSYVFSSVLMGGLTTHLLFNSFSANSNKGFLAFYILGSPAFIYAAISGSSLCLYLIFYYLLFRFILKYTATFSVFHLTIVSILIGTFLLLDLEFLKLLLLLIPIFFFSAFYKAKGITGTFYNRASLILSNDSQRRKFFSSFFSSIFVAAFIPMMGLLTFLVLNKIFAGNWYFFQESYGNSWNSYSPIYPFISSVEDYSQLIATNTPDFLIPLLLLSALALVQIFSYDGVKSKSILLILAVLYLISEVQQDKIEKLTIQHFSLLTGAGIAALFFFHTKVKKPTITRIIGMSLVIAFSLLLEWTYFGLFSIQKNERLFFQSLIKHQKDSRLDSKANFEKIFTQLPPGRILIDDAIFYSELKELSRNFTWEGHFSASYQHALQQPELYADYVVMTKSTHPLYLDDIVATAYKRLEMNQIPKNLELLFEDKQMEIYRLKK